MSTTWPIFADSGDGSVPAEVVAGYPWSAGRVRLTGLGWAGSRVSFSLGRDRRKSGGFVSVYVGFGGEVVTRFQVCVPWAAGLRFLLNVLTGPVRYGALSKEVHDDEAKPGQATLA